MKKLLITLILFMGTIFSLYSFTRGNSYVIKGKTEIKKGKAILKRSFKADTVKIKNGNFEFKGNIERLELAMVEILPQGGLPTQIILEPGNVTLTVNDRLYKIGGTQHNICLQQIKDTLSLFTAKIKTLREKSYQLQGEDQKKILIEIETINKEKAEKAAELVKANANFAGFITMLAFYHNETAGNIAYYLEEFKAFSDNPGYQQVIDHYKKIPKADIGLIAPPFTLQNTEGEMVSLSYFKNKYVLIDFWYTSCGFCRRLAPVLSKAYANFKNKGFEIIGISVDAKVDKAKWLEAIKEDKATWTELWDYNKTLPGQYGVNGYPTLFLLDREGKILQKIVGYQKETEFMEILDKYIK